MRSSLKVREAADARAFPRGLGPPRGAGNADDPVAGAEKKRDLRCLCREANDATRELDRALAVTPQIAERAEAAPPPRIR